MKCNGLQTTGFTKEALQDRVGQVNRDYFEEQLQLCERIIANATHSWGLASTQLRVLVSAGSL